MPLLTPCAYIVSYDLTQPIAKYEPFFNELRRSAKWCRYIQNTWIILSVDPLAELGPKLRSLIFTPDRLLIMPAKGPADGWLPKDAWDWISLNIPREW